MRLGLKAPAAPFSSSARDAPPRAAQPQFPVPPIVPNPSGPVGYVFDIDGVLIRGPKVLPAAQRAMQSLCPGGEWRSPVVFLTNGGGVTEATKAAELAGWLGVPVREDQVILSHTPFRQLAPALAHHPVLVCGRRDAVSVARSYGFQKVLTTYHLADAFGPAATPFGAATAPPPGAARGGGPCPVRDLGWGGEACPIRAVLVFNDPAGDSWYQRVIVFDAFGAVAASGGVRAQRRAHAVLVFNDPAGDSWYQDLQLVHDVITSHGVPLRTHPAPGSRPVDVYFSNPDLLWANDHARPRFGQGAFAAALDTLHRLTAGTPIAGARWFGKPNPEPYRLAERLLLDQAVALGLAPPAAAAHPLEHPQEHPQQERRQERPQQERRQERPSGARRVFSAIYAVGDNPAADVRGANARGPPWVSVLVRTGVFEGREANSATDPAHVVVEDVEAALTAARHRARAVKWHAMR